jgi:hypothetical protein
MTGVQLAVRIRGFRPGLPVWLATGFAARTDVVECGLPVLAKPFDQAELAQAIGERLNAPAGNGHPKLWWCENDLREMRHRRHLTDTVR